MVQFLSIGWQAVFKEYLYYFIDGSLSCMVFAIGQNQKLLADQLRLGAVKK
jgi:hypothetical protein